MNVSGSKDVTKTESGAVVNRERTVTDSSGQVIHSGTSTTNRDSSGSSTTYQRQHTNPEGETFTVTGEKTRTKTEDGFQTDGLRTVTNPEGEQHTTTFSTSGSHNSESFTSPPVTETEAPKESEFLPVLEEGAEEDATPSP